MGRAANRKRVHANPQNEGLIYVTFQFDGIKYENKHQLTASELRHMKQLCKDFGEEASGQAVWLAAIRGTGMVAENILAKAGRDYIKRHHVTAKSSISTETLHQETSRIQSSSTGQLLLGTSQEATNTESIGEISRDSESSSLKMDAPVPE